MASRIRLWFAFLGGALAWTLHFMGSYAIGEASCLMGAADVEWLGLNVMTWLLILLSILCLLFAGAAIVISRKDQLHSIARIDRQAAEVELFMTRTGLVNNLIFTLVIVAQTFPIFILGRNC